MFIDSPLTETSDDGVMALLAGLERLKDLALSLDDTARAEIFHTMFEDCLENYCALKREQLARQIADDGQATDRKRA
jgi:hypothetical protein